MFIRKGDYAVYPSKKEYKSKEKDWSYPQEPVCNSPRYYFQQWKDSVSYGQRWMAETAFSSIKRMFGEYAYSVKMENMKQELMLKALLYNKFMSL